MNTHQSAVAALLKRGRAALAAPAGIYPFTHVPEADALLNDLQGYPHAFVLACLMDRQIKAEKAWMIPYRFQQSLGTFEFDRLRRLRQATVLSLMTTPEALHRYPQEMSRNFYEAVQRIHTKYEGDASRIWAGRPSSAAVVYRFLEFRGAGPKIATMAANLLARHLKVPFSDYYSIDISVDVQVRRVLTRLGLIETNDSPEQIIYKARALSPEFPGLLDLPTWEIGRQWCRPTRPFCEACYMKRVCPAVTPTRP